MPPMPDKSIARSVGEFFGHILRAARTDVSPGTTIRHEVREARAEIGGREMILRRTTIDEVRPPTPEERE